MAERRTPRKSPLSGRAPLRHTPSSRTANSSGEIRETRPPDRSLSTIGSITPGDISHLGSAGNGARDFATAVPPATDPDVLAATSRLQTAAPPGDAGVAARAKESGIDLATGDFAEMADFEHLAQQGRVAQQDQAAFAAATAQLDRAELLARGYDAGAVCMSRTA